MEKRRRGPLTHSLNIAILSVLLAKDGLDWVYMA
jgi:hypothetical protein